MDYPTQANSEGQVLSKPDSLSDAYQVVLETARESSSVSAFYREVLPRVASIFSCPYAEIYVRLPSEIIENYYHSGATNPGFWKPLVQRFLNDSLSDGCAKARMFKSKLSGTDISIALLSAPIRHSGGSPIGAIVLVSDSDNQEQARVYLTVLESVANLISYSTEYVGKAREERMLEHSTSGKHISKVAGYSSRHELAFALTNNLRNKTGSDQTILGRVNRQKVKIIAISGHDEVHKQSPDVAKIREAMEECLDMDIPIIYQQDKSSSKTGATEYRLHRQWHESAGHGAVASIPLHTEAGCGAVISLKRNNARPFTAEELQKIRELIEPYTAAFELVDKANRSLIAHLVNSLTNKGRAMIKPEGWTKKAVTLLLVVMSGWFIFGTIDYQITVSGRVVPEKIRHFAAPLSAVLTSADAVEGDLMESGDILCIFDHQQLLMEREKLFAQLQIAQLERKDALSRKMDFAADLAAADQQLMKANLDLINHRIEQSTVRAPFDGLIISGDLQKRIGEVLPQGEPLYEVASCKRWLLELEVPEHLSADLKAGLEGGFSTNAKPELSHELSISKISPKTELQNNQNVFIAEAQVDMNSPWVRAGMEGVAKIKVERRPVWWIALHRIIDFVRLNT